MSGDGGGPAGIGPSTIISSCNSIGGEILVLLLFKSGLITV